MPDLKAHLTRAAQLIEDQAKFCRKTMPDTLKKVYLRFLAPLSPEELERAFLGWQFKSTRFPSVVELFECCGRSPTQQAEKNWMNLETKRDRIADEVCRKSGYLLSLRNLDHGSEFNAGLAKRDLKARFVAEYAEAWLDWWSRGEIEAGESIIDLSPPKPPSVLAPSELPPDPKDLDRLNSALSKLGMKVQRDKGIIALNHSDHGGDHPNSDQPEF